MAKEFSCEHCGKSETRQAERQCDHCGDGMCMDCTDQHDETSACPRAPESPTYSPCDLGVY